MLKAIRLSPRRHRALPLQRLRKRPGRARLQLPRCAQTQAGRLRALNRGRPWVAQADPRRSSESRHQCYRRFHRCVGRQLTTEHRIAPTDPAFQMHESEWASSRSLILTPGDFSSLSGKKRQPGRGLHYVYRAAGVSWPRWERCGPLSGKVNTMHNQFCPGGASPG